MVICSCSRRSNLMRRWQASCSRWGQSDISCHPTSFTTLISGSGRKPFPMRSHGLHRVYAKGRARHIDVTFARDLDFNPPEEWRQDIDQTLFPGGYFKEFIFFHKKSKTLVLTDTIINIELDKMPEP